MTHCESLLFQTPTVEVPEFSCLNQLGRYQMFRQVKSEAWGVKMNPENHRNRVLLLLACAALLAGPAKAQRTANMVSSRAKSTSAYQISKEVSLQGTVVKFAAETPTPPFGAHVLVQTPAGTTMDAHLGDANLLQLNHMTIAPGDSIRIIGENLAYRGGTVFFARLVQKGTQVVAVRSTSGKPLWPEGPRGNPAVRVNVIMEGAR
jgi:hypothetical protein